MRSVVPQSDPEARIMGSEKEGAVVDIPEQSPDASLAAIVVRLKNRLGMRYAIVNGDEEVNA